jgi:hypothetical protein
MSNLDATEPRLLPELCVADNIMAVTNFLLKEEKRRLQEETKRQQEETKRQQEEKQQEKKVVERREK